MPPSDAPEHASPYSQALTTDDILACSTTSARSLYAGDISRYSVTVTLPLNLAKLRSRLSALSGAFSRQEIQQGPNRGQQPAP